MPPVTLISLKNKRLIQQHDPRSQIRPRFPHKSSPERLHKHKLLARTHAKQKLRSCHLGCDIRST